MPAQRFSKKREAILQVLRSTVCHPSAKWVFEQIQKQYPDISLATVYRNLRQLAESAGHVYRVFCGLTEELK